MLRKTSLGIIGCGKISSAYFKGLTLFDFIEVKACADLDLEAARRKAVEFNCPRACTVEELLEDPDVEVIVNLTIPAAHAPVNRRILEAGKHAYCEKPFARNRAEGREILDLARKNGLLVGGAPDTFLGPSHQTCRHLIDTGAIGQPAAGFVSMSCMGHETWHPSPEFYYQPGGGPLWDMGPYYLTALVNLLGPVQSVSAASQITFAERIITSQPKHGQIVPVEVPTYITGIVRFASGPLVTAIFSFDARGGHTLPQFEIYGSTAALKVPDPNNFGGAIIRLVPDWKQETADILHRYEALRGIGVADLVCAWQTGRAPRAGGDLAFHILDVMQAFDESAAWGKTVEISSPCQRPAPMPRTLSASLFDHR